MRKVCVEGMFSIVLRCVLDREEHRFITQSANGASQQVTHGDVCGSGD
ncbi:MAG: hypothetical protein ACLSEY_01740 [Enterocloster sp.]